MLQYDFLDAHKRHLEDAESLYDHSRLANADHLFGISAECGLKYIMKNFGMTTDPVTGDPEDQYRVHLPDIWNRYKSFMAGMGVASYTLPSKNHFYDWSVFQRYVPQAYFNKSIIMPHKECAQYIHRLVKNSLLDGRIVL